ncbi:ATP cone domain-containing protein [Clostridium botulinum]|nr:ATP cone domain-containing protein [Clostridium botulinum]
MNIKIKKRDGQYEPLQVEKTKKMVKLACEGIEGCDPLELELDSRIQFRDGMTTKEIQRTLIQTAIEKVIQNSKDNNGNNIKKLMLIGSMLLQDFYVLIYTRKLKSVDTIIALVMVIIMNW